MIESEKNFYNQVNKTIMEAPIDNTINTRINDLIIKYFWLIKIREVFKKPFLEKVFSYINMFEYFNDKDFAAHQLFTKYLIFEEVMDNKTKNKFYKFFIDKYGTWFTPFEEYFNKKG